MKYKISLDINYENEYLGHCYTSSKECELTEEEFAAYKEEISKLKEDKLRRERYEQYLELRAEFEEFEPDTREGE